MLVFRTRITVLREIMYRRFFVCSPGRAEFHLHETVSWRWRQQRKTAGYSAGQATLDRGNFELGEIFVDGLCRFCLSREV